ncbi:hypothetical protein HY949_02995 [Candidatus Gottesmanbacteria bacterium]|nr:hypothetical protein [Candidatus Gottesmanbacteria bacterium]
MFLYTLHYSRPVLRILSPNMTVDILVCYDKRRQQTLHLLHKMVERYLMIRADRMPHHLVSSLRYPM